MNSDAVRRIQQLERVVAELRTEITQLRNQRQNQTGLIQPVIFKLSIDMDAAQELYSGISCPAARHPMWDLAAVTFSASVANASFLSPIVSGSTARTGVLVNIWQEPLAVDSFILAVPYKNVYLPTTELCPLEA